MDLKTALVLLRHAARGSTLDIYTRAILAIKRAQQYHHGDGD
jgi:hypothetical protein